MQQQNTFGGIQSNSFVQQKLPTDEFDQELQLQCQDTVSAVKFGPQNIAYQ
jgi:hypothetical protein